MSVERGKDIRVGADESTFGTIASREVLRCDDGDSLAGLRLHQQNLTRGNRAESAFISTDPNIFASLYAQIEDLITNHSVPLNDLFRERITAD